MPLLHNLAQDHICQRFLLFFALLFFTRRFYGLEPLFDGEVDHGVVEKVGEHCLVELTFLDGVVRAISTRIPRHHMLRIKSITTLLTHRVFIVPLQLGTRLKILFHFFFDRSGLDYVLD